MDAGDAWKVNRIRRDPRVTLRPCGRTGKVRAEQPVLAGTGEVITDPNESAPGESLIKDKYGLEFRVVTVVETVAARGRKPRVVLRITPLVPPDTRRECARQGSVDRRPLPQTHRGWCSTSPKSTGSAATGGEAFDLRRTGFDHMRSKSTGGPTLCVLQSLPGAIALMGIPFDLGRSTARHIGLDLCEGKSE